MERSLDRFDIALLNKLQEDNLSTAEMLTEAVPLSPSAITRRIRRLREEGFIAADVAILTGAHPAARPRSRRLPR
jgi:Lrp/AsnC family transcriptional regulator, leucine-responsive regulatory protein